MEGLDIDLPVMVLKAAPRIAAAAIMLIPVWTDLRQREVPNLVPVALVVLWVATFILARESSGLEAASVVPAALLFVLGFVLHALGWLGGGDGKLLAATALWIAPDTIGLVLLGIAGIGLWMVGAALVVRSFRERGLPFAAAIAPPASLATGWPAVEALLPIPGALALGCLCRGAA